MQIAQGVNSLALPRSTVLFLQEVIKPLYIGFDFRAEEAGHGYVTKTVNPLPPIVAFWLHSRPPPIVAFWQHFRLDLFTPS